MIEIATSLYTPEPSGVRLRSTFVASLDLISKDHPLTEHMTTKNPYSSERCSHVDEFDCARDELASSKLFLRSKIFTVSPR